MFSSHSDFFGEKDECTEMSIKALIDHKDLFKCWKTSKALFNYSASTEAWSTCIYETFSSSTPGQRWPRHLRKRDNNNSVSPLPALVPLVIVRYISLKVMIWTQQFSVCVDLHLDATCEIIHLRGCNEATQRRKVKEIDKKHFSVISWFWCYLPAFISESLNFLSLKF